MLGIRTFKDAEEILKSDASLLAHVNGHKQLPELLEAGVLGDETASVKRAVAADTRSKITAASHLRRVFSIELVWETGDFVLMQFASQKR